MKGITSGLGPARLKDGGFPDLTGDGKVTQKDILRGRGVEGFKDGGDASQDFYNLQKTASGSGMNARDFTDLIFDPSDPVDYFMLPLLFFPPAAIAARLIKVGVKGNKLRKKMAKVEKLQNAKGFKKIKNTATTNPMDTLSAANGLLLGPTRQSIKGAAAQMGVRNELADLTYAHNTDMDQSYPGFNLSSKELRVLEEEDRLLPPEDRELTREQGIATLRELPEIASNLSQLEASQLAEGVRGIPSLISDAASDADFSRYNPTNMLPDKVKKSVDKVGSRVVENISTIPKGIYDMVASLQDDPEEMAGGGIVYAKVGKAISFLNDLSKKSLNKLPKNKDGSVKMNSKEVNKAKADFDAKKKQATADKSKATREANKQKAVRDEAERLARLKRASDARTNTGQSAQQRLNSRSAQADVGPPRPIAGADGPIKGQGPAISSKVDDANASSNAAKKVDDDLIQPGGDPSVDTRTFGQKVIPYVSPNVFNPNTKARTLKTLGGITLAASTYDPNEEDATSKGDGTGDGKKSTIYDDDIFNNDPQAKIPDRDPTAWADIMKARIVNDRGIPLDDKGNFTEKPKFMDYLKSLPGAYGDKVSRDEDFAKKMIAGFLNMMRPVEGFVPVNSAVAFGDAYFNEETRQADMLPADAKMLEYLKGDDEAFERYLRAEQAKSGVLLADTKSDLARDYYDTLIDSLAITQMPGVNVIDLVNKGKIRLVRDGIPIGVVGILALMGKNVNVLSDPSFKLEYVDSEE
ncbi:MAG TPA: hypothetical protein DEO86_01590 [Colwellia sp.]|nr:hypothetical protein [Colwellia sp.]